MTVNQATQNYVSVFYIVNLGGASLAGCHARIDKSRIWKRVCHSEIPVNRLHGRPRRKWIDCVKGCIARKEFYG